MGLTANMPDICIIYQLHLECGKMINLYDWMQVQERGFETVLYFVPY